jgi:hypothetical protein
MEHTASALNKLTEQIIGAAIHVHRALGPGLLESATRPACIHELVARGLKVERRSLAAQSADIAWTACIGWTWWSRTRGRESQVGDQDRSRARSAQMLSYLKLSKNAFGLIINSTSRIDGV